MGLFNFFRKKSKQEKQLDSFLKNKNSYPSYQKSTPASYSRPSGNNPSNDQSDLLNPLNPLSPLWFGHQQPDNYSTPQDNNHSYGGGGFGGAGAGGSWDNSSNDSGSSYDSGSSDSGSSDCGSSSD